MRENDQIPIPNRWDDEAIFGPAGLQPIGSAQAARAVDFVDARWRILRLAWEHRQGGSHQDENEYKPDQTCHGIVL